MKEGMIPMRTTLNIRDDLIEQLLRLTGEKTRTAAVNRALREYLLWHRRQAIKGLTGRIHVELDLRRLRQAENDEA